MGTDLEERFWKAAGDAARIGIDAACEASFGVLWRIAKPMVAVFREAPADRAMSGLLEEWGKEAAQAADRALLAKAVVDAQDDVFSQMLRQISNARAETSFEGNARRLSLRVQMMNAAILGSAFEDLCRETDEGALGDAMQLVTYRLLLLGATMDQVRALFTTRMQGNADVAHNLVLDIVSSRAHPFALAPLHMGMAASATRGTEQYSRNLKSIEDNFALLGFPPNLYSAAVEACETLLKVESFCQRLADAL
jgi:hypothetical protein